MAFRFRLEKILQIKHKLRDAKKAELGYVESEINRRRDEIARINERLGDLSFPSEPVDFASLSGNFAMISVLREREKRLLEEIEELEGERERIVEEMVELQRDIKVLEKLKQKRWEEFRREMLRKEIKLLDELALRGKRDV